MIDRVARSDWAQLAQTFELEHWKTAQTRGFGIGAHCLANDIARIHAGFRGVSQQIWENFGFTEDAFVGMQCLDIGCGPLGRCSWLLGEWSTIEPLADQYRKELAYAYLPYEHVYSQAAEKRIGELVGQFVAVVSLNCLDHCFDANLVLKNAFDYLAPSGVALLSFDVDKPCKSDPTHPINMTHDEATTLIESVGFAVTKIAHGKCYPRVDGTWRDNWGGGTAYHWWLTKPKA